MTSLTDVTQAYLASSFADQAIKPPVRLAATVNITPIGIGQTIDGAVTQLGDRILLTAQTDARQNGIRVVSDGIWSVPGDFSNLVQGTLFTVTAGVANAGQYSLTTANPIILGTSALTFITSVVGGLAAETAARIAADNTLQANINAEASTRATNDTALQTNISAEATARATGDSNLASGATPITQQDATFTLQNTPDPTKRARFSLSSIATGTLRIFTLPNLSATLADLTTLAASAGASLIGFLQAGVSAVARTIQSKLMDEVSILDFGADPTGATSSVAAITAANATGKNVYAPAGNYKIDSTIAVPNRHGYVLRGEYQQTVFTCTVGGSTPILTFPTGLGASGYGVVEGITFAASGAGAGNAIGVSAPGAYTFSMDFRYCSFKASLRKGIIGTYLCCDFYRCDWGTLTSPFGTFKAIEMIGNGTFESVVSFRYCEIAGSNDTIAIEIDFADQVRFEGCVIEPNSASTATIMVRDTLGFTLEYCWAETNGAVPLVKGADGAHSPVDTRFEFNRCHLEGNGSGANDVILDVSTGTGQKSIFTHNVINSFTHIILYPGGNYNLPGTGVNQVLAFWNNKIFGGTPGFLGTSDYAGGLNQYYGTLGNDDAPAGCIGEVITASRASGSATALSTTVSKTVTSVVLTAGDWDVDAMCAVVAAATTNFTSVAYGLSLVDNTLGAEETIFQPWVPVPGGYVPGASTLRSSVFSQRVKVGAGATTSVFLVANANFTVAAATAWGTIRARRRR